MIGQRQFFPIESILDDYDVARKQGIIFAAQETLRINGDRVACAVNRDRGRVARILILGINECAVERDALIPGYDRDFDGANYPDLRGGGLLELLLHLRSRRLLAGEIRALQLLLVRCFVLGRAAEQCKAEREGDANKSSCSHSETYAGKAGCHFLNGFSRTEPMAARKSELK
jgi:hypothetical protein